MHLPPGPKRGTHKGYGFVVFARKEDADRSLEANGVALKSRALEVSIAQVNPGKPTKPGNAITAPPDSPPEDASPTPSFDDIKKKTLGVLHLADTVNDTRLRSLFSPFGTLRKVQLRPEHQGAVVEYENVADAGRAALAMQGREVDGMTLRISDLEELMKETPRGRVLKGFVAAPRKALGAPVVPASGRGAGRGGRRGLGFVGAIVARREEGGGKVEEKGEEGGKGRSNEDFKKMFLAGK